MHHHGLTILYRLNPTPQNPVKPSPTVKPSNPKTSNSELFLFLKIRNDSARTLATEGAAIYDLNS